MNRRVLLGIAAAVAVLVVAFGGAGSAVRADGGGSVSGTIYFDSNMDGFREPDEPGAPGYRVELRREAGGLADTSTSDTSGQYSFDGLLADTNYTVVLVLGDGDLCGGEPVSVSGDGEIEGLDFWVVRKGPGALSGTHFNDTDEDAMHDAGEPPLAGWSVTLSTGSCYLPATTAVDGSYEVTQLPSGAYSLYAAPNSPQEQGLWEQTTQTEQAPWDSPVADLHVPVPLDLTANDELRDVDVGMHLLKGTGSISGVYFRDYDLDGLKDETEPVLECLWGYFFGIARRLPAGFSLYLDLVPTCEGGRFEVGGLPAGEYNVLFTAWCYDIHPQQPPTPWVTLAEGEHTTGANIGLCPEIQGPTPEPTEGPPPSPEAATTALPPINVGPPDTGSGGATGQLSVSALAALGAIFLAVGLLGVLKVRRLRQ